MSPKDSQQLSYPLYLEGGGEMGKLTRSFDWSKTALGGPENWSQNLLTTLSIILHSRFPMFLWWGPDLIQFYNDAYRPSLGNEGKHPVALGQKGAECWPEIWPVIKPLIDQVMAGGEATWNEDQLIPIYRNNKLEDVYWTFCYSRVIDINGQIGGVLVTCNETTNKVKTRQLIEEKFLQFQQLADAIIQMVWVTDALGMHEYYNQRWYDFTGSTLEESQGEGWNQMFHPDDRERAWKSWEHSLKTGAPYEIEYRLRKHTGEYIWVLGRAAPFYNAEGTIIKWFGTCTDIHEQKIIQEEKDDFISIASHELKTPVTTLKVSLQLMNRMKDEPLPVMMSNLIDRANKSMDKVGTLIEDLLNTSKYSHGQLHLNKTDFTIGKIINECYDQINPEKKHLLKTTGDMNLQIYADADRIGQVIINFINNAIKYAPESDEINVDVTQIGEFVKFSVNDQGAGIAQDKIPHLFDRYFRVDSAGSQYSGLGLGLYICSEIIKKHLGEIGVNSEAGKGSSFWFTLPISK